MSGIGGIAIRQDWSGDTGVTSSPKRGCVGLELTETPWAGDLARVNVLLATTSAEYGTDRQER